MLNFFKSRKIHCVSIEIDCLVKTRIHCYKQVIVSFEGKDKLGRAKARKMEESCREMKIAKRQKIS